MSNKNVMSLVKYAGDYWVTLADFTKTRDSTGYSDLSSVKSAIRTFVVKSNPDKYIAFRGEKQLKNIINENRSNDLFDSEDFKGTRTALIHWTMLEQLEERFKPNKESRVAYNKFLNAATKHIEADSAKAIEAADSADSVETNGLSSNSAMVRQIRLELSRIDKEIEVRQNNREKLLQALNAIESLELEEAK